jgi:hypothetical protein
MNVDVSGLIIEKWTLLFEIRVFIVPILSMLIYG